MESPAFTPGGWIDSVYRNGTHWRMHPPPFPPLPSDVETLPGIFSPEEVAALRRENHRLRAERDDARLRLSSPGVLLPPPRRMTGWGATLGGVLVLLLPALGAALAKRWPHLAAPIDAVLQLALDTAHGLGL